MHVVSPFDIPALRAGLHLLGWATTDARTMAQDGAFWFVAFAERDGQEVRGEGPTEAAAWAEVGWKALGDQNRLASGGKQTCCGPARGRPWIRAGFAGAGRDEG